MTARPRLLIAALVAVVATLLGPTTAAAPAPTAPGAACSGDSGVTVVVDFAALGGGTQVRCAPGDPRSGLEALSLAGFGYGFHPRNLGMVCTIDNRPDPCNGAPPDAYWSYWHASRGGPWTYSTEGAGTYDPAPGSVEGWAFGAGAQPSTSPPRPTPTTTTTTTATKVPPPPSPAPSPSPTPASSPDPATDGDAPPVAAPDGADGTTAATTTVGDGPAPTNDRAPIPDPERGRVSSGSRDAIAGSDIGGDEQVLGSTRTSGEGGGGAGALVGLVLAAVVAATALWELRRRRSPT